ncbi:uncharacterized protein LOC144373748 [Ictidomys tridecemlineatus]
MEGAAPGIRPSSCCSQRVEFDLQGPVQDAVASAGWPAPRTSEEKRGPDPQAPGEGRGAQDLFNRVSDVVSFEALRKCEQEQVGDIFQVEALPEEEVIKLAKKPFCEAPVDSRLLRKNSCVETNSSWAFAFDVAHFCEWMRGVTYYLHICMLGLTLLSYLVVGRKSILKLSSCVLAAELKILGVPPSAIHAALFMFLIDFLGDTALKHFCAAGNSGFCFTLK